MKRYIVLFLIFVLTLPTLSIYGQDFIDECETYELIEVETPNFEDAGLDIRTLRCATVHVLNEDGAIVDVFIIAEDTIGSYLRGADFSGQDITDLDFSFANLRDAILNEITAEFVMFVNSDFTRATLDSANLSFAYFNFATLTEASLVNANLQGAELSDADLIFSNLEGANLDNVIGYEGE